MKQLAFALRASSIRNLKEILQVRIELEALEGSAAVEIEDKKAVGICSYGGVKLIAHR